MSVTSHKVISKDRKYDSFLKLDLIKVEVNYEDGTKQELDRYLVNGSNAASVFIYDTKNDLALMVEQFRIGMVNDESASSLECPAGLIDAGETAEQAIVREVFEETGERITPDMLSQVSDASYVSCGMTDIQISVFICECDLSNVKESIQGTDEEEYIFTRLVPYSTLIQRLKNKEIKHITQIAALQHSVLKSNGLI